MDRDSVAAGFVLLITLLVSGSCLLRMRVLGVGNYGKWRRLCERIVLSLAMLIALAAGTGATFNVLAAHHYRALHPAAGRFYVVDGYKMHLYCTGEGSPTIVLDAGLGNDSLIWAKVQPELSKTTRVCSYDRAGFGWSDPQPGPHDAERIADQLHSLLTQAGITGATVLMGHSIAGLYIRAYVNRYPHNVSGLVFVDSSTPLQEDRFPADPEDTKNPELELLELKWLYMLGIPRVMGQCTHEAGFDDYAGRMIAEDQCRPSLWTAVGQEEKSGRQSGNETIHTGPFGDLPILIFSEDPQLSVSSALPTKPEIEMAKIWDEMQEDLKHLSTRSRRIIAKSSSHYIQIDRPDLLNQNVARFIQQIRGESLHPTDYGSTRTE
jgi:pimeloyl-ACP methyl ester carboxylesterase